MINANAKAEKTSKICFLEILTGLVTADGYAFKRGLNRNEELT